MNRSFLRRASLFLSLISPLLVVSCSSPADKGTNPAPADTVVQLCTSCVDFNLYAWMFTPDAGVDVRTLSGMAPDLSEKNASADMQRLSKEARPAEIQQRLRQSGRAEAVLNFYSVTMTGQALPVSTDGPAGEFSAVLTPVALTTDDTPDLIHFELHSVVPQGGATRREEASSKGTFRLKEDRSLLNLQKVGKDYVVWLITAKNPV